MNEGIKTTQQTVTRSDSIVKLLYKVSNRLVYRGIKRLFDIIVASVGLLALLPIAIIVKISYLASGDHEKIFFVQKRIGRNGKLFNFYKFRTMIPNADEELERLLRENRELKEEYRINKKLSDDPRITKMGKILRRTSLDELPQVINILLSQMSVIGNRPYLPKEKDDMGVAYNTVVSTKPGLTGYWQVHGRSDVTFERRVELETYYSEHCGLIMDIGIFFKTIKVVLFGRGAK